MTNYRQLTAADLIEAADYELYGEDLKYDLDHFLNSRVGKVHYEQYKALKWGATVKYDDERVKQCSDAGKIVAPEVDEDGVPIKDKEFVLDYTLKHPIKYNVGADKTPVLIKSIIMNEPNAVDVIVPGELNWVNLKLTQIVNSSQPEVLMEGLRRMRIGDTLGVMGAFNSFRFWDTQLD